MTSDDDDFGDFRYVASPDNDYSDIDVNKGPNEMFSFDDANISRSIDSEEELDSDDVGTGTPSDVHVRK
jgi:hypothetical protein